jgi:hypothetical protein
LLRTGTWGVKVFLRISFDLGSATLARLDLIPEIAEPIDQSRLVDRCGEVLGIEEALRMESARRTILSFRHVEDDGVGVELRRSVAIDRASGIMLELRGDEFPGRLGRAVPADPRLGVPLKLGESRGDCFAIGFPYPLIAADKCGQRHGFRSGKGCISPGPVLDRLCGRAVRAPCIPGRLDVEPAVHT